MHDLLQLEAQSQRFEECAKSVGLQLSDDAAQPCDALSIAQDLLVCPTESSVKATLTLDPKGAVAFWRIARAVVELAREGKIGSQPVRVHHHNPYSILAHTSQEYIQQLIASPPAREF